MRMDDLNVTGTEANVVFDLIPFIVLVSIFIRIYYWITGKDIDTAVDYSYAETPKEILQLRYAKGEIDNLEYLERMSRL